jgi:hypothetical protein
MMEQMLEHLLATQEKTQANMKADRKADNEIMAEMKADWDVHVQEIVAKTVSAIEGKMEAIVHSSQSERDEKTQHWRENVTERKEIPKKGAAVASLECERQGPKDLESGAEHQLVPADKVIRKSSRMKKRPRGRCIAAGRRVKPTKLTRGDGESRRKLVAACRKVSRRAAVAWRRRNIFRNLRTQGNCGPRKELAAAGKMLAHCTGIAQ